MATVVNKRNTEYDIYIGRESIWGNPFKIGQDRTRDDVIKESQCKYCHGEGVIYAINTQTNTKFPSKCAHCPSDHQAQ